MIEGKITNIVLKGSQFQVFAEIDGNREENIFLPDVTADAIRSWLQERIDYYTELRERESSLQGELIN